MACDPRSRRAMWHIIRELVADGVTIFLTTQYLEEADRLADRIALLDGGRLVAEGTPEQLKRLVPGGHITLQLPGVRELDAASRLLGDVTRNEESLTLQVPGDGNTPDLDDVFLALTERAATRKESLR